MSLMRTVLLKASQSSWLRQQAPRYKFVRATVSRFMPGEQLEDSIRAAQSLAGDGMKTVFTHLGENITSAAEAEQVRDQYLSVLDRIRSVGLKAEISVKLTHLGLDLGDELCYQDLAPLIERAGANNVVWIDMESSAYTERTLELFYRARAEYANIGVCVQAYLYRTKDDIERLMAAGAAVRLVKGAYNEPPSVAFPRKHDVDENFFALSKR